MKNQMFSWDRFYPSPIIGIVRNFSLKEMIAVLPVYQEAGLHTIEITMNTAGAAGIIRYIRKNYPALNTGAGTICTTDDLQVAIDAGAQFIVTPVVNKKIIKTCVKKELPVFPGAFSPTEIQKAWSLGASMVKVYPANALGAGYIKDIKAPLHQVKLLPTGGIGLDDIEPFRTAGADGFGIGSPLFVKEIIDQQNWAVLLEHFRKFEGRAKIPDFF